MKPIQHILIVILLIGVVLYLRAFRSKLFDRAIVLILFALGAGLVMLPDSATDIANLLGVGRGADLVTYLGLLMFGYLWLHLYSKMRHLDRKNTELVRALAIENAHRTERLRQLPGIDRIRKAG